jgi:hypothetical protein
MKAYVATTGTIFGLITLAHFWRMAAESRDLAGDPIFIILTVLSAFLCVWAVLLLKRSKV